MNKAQDNRQTEARPRKSWQVGGDRFTFIDLFAGIGGFRVAMESLGGRCVFSSEWDKYAQKTYQANFGEVPHGDITLPEVKAQIPDGFDLLCAGFPCQAFSIAGKRRGFEEARGTLFFDVAEIISQRRPKAVLLENVKGLVSHDRGRTLSIILRILREDLGYQVYHQVLSSQGYTAQRRERIFIVALRTDIASVAGSFTFPEEPSHRYTIAQILETEVCDKYTLSDKLWAYLQAHALRHQAKGNGFGFGLVHLDGQARTLSARYYKDGSEVLIPQQGKNPRKLTPRECARLQGFPDDYDIIVSDTQSYKQFGNSVAVPVVRAVAEAILSTFI